MKEYTIEFAIAFKKAIKKLNKQDTELCFSVIERLAKGEILEQKYKDHALKGEYKGYRDCHIKPDLILIYKKQDENLTLVCVELGSHSELGL